MGSLELTLALRLHIPSLLPEIALPTIRLWFLILGCRGSFDLDLRKCGALCAMLTLLTHDERFHRTESLPNSSINCFGVQAIIVDPTAVLRTTNDIVNMLAKVGPDCHWLCSDVRSLLWTKLAGLFHSTLSHAEKTILRMNRTERMQSWHCHTDSPYLSMKPRLSHARGNGGERETAGLCTGMIIHGKG